MSEVKIYLRPRPVSSVYGHASYLPFQWHPDFKYGPFFAGYGTIPSDATEEYTIHSPDLSAAIAAFHNELIPSFQAEVPEITLSQWRSLVELQETIMGPVARFILQSQTHVNRLYRTLFPLSTADVKRDELFFSILARGDAELREDVDVDTEVEIFVWAYMHYMVYYSCLPWYKFQKDLRYPGQSLSLDAHRAKALIFPSQYIRGKGNTNTQPSNDPSVLNSVTPSSLLR